MKRPNIDEIKTHLLPYCNQIMKSIEETHSFNGLSDTHYLADYLPKCVQYIEELELRERKTWTPVSQGLPDFGVEVLVVVFMPQFKQKYRRVVAIRDELTGYWMTGISVLHHVTHWQGLADLPVVDEAIPPETGDNEPSSE
jgi:hypothetical protein